MDTKGWINLLLFNVASRYPAMNFDIVVQECLNIYDVQLKHVPLNKHETEDLDDKVIVKTVTVIEDKIQLNPW